MTLAAATRAGFERPWGLDGYARGAGYARMRPRVVLPRTRAETKSRLRGLDPSALYYLEEASGTVVDVVAALNLASAGAPEFRKRFWGKWGIRYDPGGESHLADVLALGTSSGIYASAIVMGPTVSTDGIVGRGNVTVAEWAAIWVAVPASGILGASVRDSGAGALDITCATDVRNGGLVLATMQVDRAASQLRMRLSSLSFGRFLASNSGSIAGHATYDGAGQMFGFGAIPGVGSSGIWAGWGAGFLGTQCEGANMLRDISRMLGGE